MSVEEAAELVGVTKATGYLKGNSNGYEGLIPEFEEDLLNLQKELREMLKEKDFSLYSLLINPNTGYS